MQKKMGSYRAVKLCAVSITAIILVSCANPEKPPLRPQLGERGITVVSDLLSVLRPLEVLSDIKNALQTFSFDRVVSDLPSTNLVPLNPALPECINFYKALVDSSKGSLNRYAPFSTILTDSLVDSAYADDTVSFRYAITKADSVFNTVKDTMVGHYKKSGLLASAWVRIDTLWRIRTLLGAQSTAIADTEIYTGSDTTVNACILSLIVKTQTIQKSGTTSFTQRSMRILKNVAQEVVRSVDPSFGERVQHVTREIDTTGLPWTILAGSRVFSMADTLKKGSAVSTVVFADSARTINGTLEIDGVVYIFTDSVQTIRVLTNGTVGSAQSGISVPIFLDYSQQITSLTKPRLTALTRRENGLSTNYNEYVVSMITDSTALLSTLVRHSTKDPAVDQFLEGYDSSRIYFSVKHDATWDTNQIVCSSLKRTDYFKYLTADTLPLDSAVWNYTPTIPQKFQNMTAPNAGPSVCNLFYGGAQPLFRSKSSVWSRSTAGDTVRYFWLGSNKDSLGIIYIKDLVSGAIRYSSPTRLALGFDYHGSITPQTNGGCVVSDSLELSTTLKNGYRIATGTFDAKGLGTLMIGGYGKVQDSAEIILRADSIIFTPALVSGSTLSRIAWPAVSRIKEISFANTALKRAYTLNLKVPREGGFFGSFTTTTGVIEVTSIDLQCSPAYKGSATLGGLYDGDVGYSTNLTGVLSIKLWNQSQLTGTDTEF